MHAGLHVGVARGLPIEEADRIAEQVHEEIHRHQEPGFCVIKVEAADEVKEMTKSILIADA